MRLLLFLFDLKMQTPFPIVSHPAFSDSVSLPESTVLSQVAELLVALLAFRTEVWQLQLALPFFQERMRQQIRPVSESLALHRHIALRLALNQSRLVDRKHKSRSKERR